MRDRLWTKEFTIDVCINFLLYVIMYQLMLWSTQFAIHTWDATVSEAGLASGIFIIGALSSRIVTGHVIDASLAYYLIPLMSILIGCCFFRESLSGLQKLAVVLATVGVLYAVVSYGVVPWLALIIGGSFAAYGAVKKTVTVDGVTSLAVECLWMLVPALVMMIWLWAQGQTAAAGETMVWWQWLLLPTTGIVTALPLFVFGKGIQTTSYSLSGILMYVNPPLQLLCGVFLFHEAFTRTYAVMFAFVWAAVVLYLASAWLQHRQRR